MVAEASGRGTRSLLSQRLLALPHAPRNLETPCELSAGAGPTKESTESQDALTSFQKMKRVPQMMAGQRDPRTRARLRSGP